MWKRGFLNKPAPEDKVPPYHAIATPRLFLQSPSHADWENWLSVRSENKAFLEPFEPSWPPDWDTRAHFNARLNYMRISWEQNRGRYFLIYNKDQTALKGGININNICRGAAQFASLGYWLAEKDQGRGYMHEAMTAILKYAFQDLNLHRIHAATLAYNQRSINLLERCCFKREGFAEKYMQINGIWQDHILFGMPRENWQKSQEKQGD